MMTRNKDLIPVLNIMQTNITEIEIIMIDFKKIMIEITTKRTIILGRIKEILTIKMKLPI